MQGCVSESPCMRKHNVTGPEIPVPQHVSDKLIQFQIERTSTAIGRQVTYPMFDRPTPKSVLEHKDQQLRSRPDCPILRFRIRHPFGPVTRNQWLNITMETSPHLHDPPLLDGTFSFTGPLLPHTTPCSRLCQTLLIAAPLGTCR